MFAKQVKVLACAVVATVLAGQASVSSAAVVIFDDFNRGDGAMGNVPVTGEAWLTSVFAYQIASNQAVSQDDNVVATVAFAAPTDATYSVSALTTRTLAGASNHSQGLQFADTGAAPAGVGASGLTLAIDIAGNIIIWENVFANQRASGKTLADAGLALNYAGQFSMLLEYDPVATNVRAVVNGVEIYNFSHTISDPVGYTGFFQSITGIGAQWDDFTVDVVPEPASMALMGLGGLLVLRRRA